MVAELEEENGKKPPEEEEDTPVDDETTWDEEAEAGLGVLGSVAAATFVE